MTWCQFFSLTCLLLVLWGAATLQGNPLTVPTLIVEAPDALENVANQTQELDLGRLVGIMHSIGIKDPGPPIRVLLLPDDSPSTRDVPPWVAGFFDSENDTVVVFPDRVGSYPYGSIERVLYHEITHVLVDRASENAEVPRWFNEGLAGLSEDSWGFQTQSRLAWHLLLGRPVTATQIEGMFRQGPQEVARAYTLADALVRNLIEQHGPFMPARIFSRMKQGESFETAFHTVSQITVTQHFSLFWANHAVWDRWIAFIGQPFTLWSFVTLLALVAIWRHRIRRLERRRKWDLEERTEEQTWENHRRSYRIH